LGRFPLSWFSAASVKKFSVFTLLLNEVIVIDIVQGFLPVFAFIVVAFSFALHEIRVEFLGEEQHYNVALSVYDALAASFGLGEQLLKNTTEQVSSAGVGLFAVVFMAYLFFTAIIMINVLIATISNHYKLAKRRAEHFWRYRTLHTWLQLEPYLCFRKKCGKNVSIRDWKYND